jgi:hypothetical protein
MRTWYERVRGAEKTFGNEYIISLREVFEVACRRAEMAGFALQHLRHTVINNWRLQGIDYFRIMAATGPRECIQTV